MENFIRRKSRMLRLIIDDVYFKKHHKISIHNTEKTLQYLINTQASISRFGDGEFNLINGKDLEFQRYDAMLSDRLKQILYVSNDIQSHVVAIPYAMVNYSDYTPKSVLFWMKYFAQYRKKIWMNLQPNYYYFDAQITRIYINRKNKKDSTTYFKLWKSIWDKKNVIIVEGIGSRFGVGNDLLENAESVRRILCPPVNAFDVYDEILNAIYSTHGYDLVLLVLGPTATVMAYDLARNGIRAIDSGNMDMEYEWMKHCAKSQIALDGRYTLEAVNGTNITDIEDEAYERQVMKKIGC